MVVIDLRELQKECVQKRKKNQFDQLGVSAALTHYASVARTNFISS